METNQGIATYFTLIVQLFLHSLATVTSILQVKLHMPCIQNFSAMTSLSVEIHLSHITKEFMACSEPPKLTPKKSMYGCGSLLETTNRKFFFIRIYKKLQRTYVCLLKSHIFASSVSFNVTEMV